MCQTWELQTLALLLVCAEPAICLMEHPKTQTVTLQYLALLWTRIREAGAARSACCTTCSVRHITPIPSCPDTLCTWFTSPLANGISGVQRALARSVTCTAAMHVYGMAAHCRPATLWIVASCTPHPAGDGGLVQVAADSGLAVRHWPCMVWGMPVSNCCAKSGPEQPLLPPSARSDQYSSSHRSRARLLLNRLYEAPVVPSSMSAPLSVPQRHPSPLRASLLWTIPLATLTSTSKTL